MPYISAGQRFNRLTAKTDAPLAKDKIVFLCDCGNEKLMFSNNVKSGKSTSCGCFHKEQTSKHTSTHGMGGSRIYSIWRDMLNRCYLPNRRAYKNYGGRGITVCEDWRGSFESFYEDMGDPPSARHELDRIDNSRGYFKDNCRWATPRENGNNTRRNRRLTAFGETKTMSYWAEDPRCKVSYETLSTRIQRGWKHEYALTADPIKQGGVRTPDHYFIEEREDD